MRGFPPVIKHPVHGPFNSYAKQPLSSYWLPTEDFGEPNYKQIAIAVHSGGYQKVRRRILRGRGDVKQVAGGNPECLLSSVVFGQLSLVVEQWLSNAVGTVS